MGVAVSASFSCDRTQKYLCEIKLMAFVDVLLIYTMSRENGVGVLQGQSGRNKIYCAYDAWFALLSN